MLQFVMSRADISWLQVALKTLIVIHRLLREGDGTFKEDFLTYSYRGNVLQIPQFKDDSSPLGAHSSCIFRAWVQNWRPSLCLFCSTFYVLSMPEQTGSLLASLLHAMQLGTAPPGFARTRSTWTSGSSASGSSSTTSN